jgi:tRNA A37 threonylcarbamoyladenosine modification protein TsaB
LARQYVKEGSARRFNVVIDAQRGEFYLATYEVVAGNASEISPMRIVPPATVKDRESAGEALIGPEVNAWFPVGRKMFPSAATLAELAGTRADFVSGESLEPIYLRETAFVKTSVSLAR